MTIGNKGETAHKLARPSCVLFLSWHLRYVLLIRLSVKFIYFILIFSQQPQIILLREGTDTSQGKGQLISNINACSSIADAVRTTLGPRGMDKLIVDERKV